MPSIDRARETRVLAHLARRVGISTRDALDAVDRIEADQEVWTQLRLALAYTDDDDQVAGWFRLAVGRPTEVVSAWGGIVTPLTLYVHADAPHLYVCVAS